MHINERLDDHQKFKELAALAQRGAISDIEQLELNNHLGVCRDCRQVFDEYSLISAVGIPFLAATSDGNHDTEGWENQLTRDRLMARVRSLDKWDAPDERAKAGNLGFGFNPQNSALRWGAAVLAACVLLAIGASMYWMSVRTRTAKEQSLSASVPGLHGIAAKESAKSEAEERLAVQNEKIGHLQSELTKAQHEVSRLQEALQASETRSAVAAASSAKTVDQLREASSQRDDLAAQLRDAEQSYQLLQAELTSLRADHEKTLVHTTSLQTRVDELEASAREHERKLKDDEEYLASDRDIRELMGARKLYIADVFDVDSGSRARKPFGRVFYTQNKSLIFYAFDLDREPGLKTASAFQVWGQREGAEEQRHATNLGILYMDSESNRRWVLKIADPKQLAEIDAVFVTIEPHGGSQKPSGKPFLYALLRREANHP
jgi:peptidoglycan hydrolase CwlO-like protein